MKVAWKISTSIQPIMIIREEASVEYAACAVDSISSICQRPRVVATLFHWFERSYGPFSASSVLFWCTGGFGQNSGMVSTRDIPMSQETQLFISWVTSKTWSQFTSSCTLKPKRLRTISGAWIVKIVWRSITKSAGPWELQLSSLRNAWSRFLTLKRQEKEEDSLSRLTSSVLITTATWPFGQGILVLKPKHFMIENTLAIMPQKIKTTVLH